ncbi:MAG: flagellar protein FlaG [Candidatus Tectomicrobia bacterium]|uniref:Flagellar protein FlaG n=1 Tax=Tectimicrobiota bacterium TaxID=2528274 RepID=A0A932CPU6_UNCTE|nr:flagellar protein FlaG [Candidatus Tectomicrobia bacterium]
MVNNISNIGLPALPLPAPVYQRPEVTAVAEVKEVTSTEGRETMKVTVSKRQASTESKGTALAEEERGAEVKSTLLSLEELEGNVDSANKLMEYLNRRINFTIDDKTERVVVKIVDGRTNEVIRQIPPEEMVAMMRRLKDLVDGFKGLLYSHRG